jgi:hypothetical protein
LCTSTPLLSNRSARAKNGNVEPASSSSRGANKSKMKRSFTLPAAAASLLLLPSNSPPPTDISILTQSAGSTVNQSPDITVGQWDTNAINRYYKCESYFIWMILDFSLHFLIVFVQ